MSLALIADIGGTNARFALTDPSRDEPVVFAERTLRTDAFASLQHAAEHYLAGVGEAPRRAAIAVASPVDGDTVRLTNCAWSFDRHELAQALRLDALLLLNDFGAVARAVPALAPEHVAGLHGDPAAPRELPLSVLGPGTGLGVALLVAGADGRPQVVETEGGHVGFAPQCEEEQAIARWLAARFGRVSNERLLSGAGLSHIDAALRAGGDLASALDPQALLREPAQVVAAALDGHDVFARRALARFCAVLGSVAGDCALIHGARTVMIAGGIVPRFVPFLRSSAFRERFLDKGRFAAYLEDVAIQVVLHPNPGLLGAAVALRERG